MGVAAVVPRLATAGHFQTTDEVFWLLRSEAFSDGLMSASPSQMTASRGEPVTMPGILTMWVGSIGRFLWAAADVMGLRRGDVSFSSSRAGMAIAHVVMAVATSAVIAVFVLVASRWCGRVAATFAGVVLATEPFLVAHGALLHTDELMMLCGINGSLLALLAWEGRERRRRSEVGAGVLLAGAALTKIAALALAPGLAVVAVHHVLRRRHADGGSADSLRRILFVALAALATFIAAWPALWVDPIGQLEFLRRSAMLANEGFRTYFQGEVSSTPEPSYYLVAVPLRMSPWFLLCLALVPLAASREVRSRLVTLVVLAAPAFVIISTSAKVYDRYALIVIPHLALAMGLGATVVARAIRARVPARRSFVPVGAAVVAATVHAVAVAPYGLTYFNPLLGGSRVAEHTMLVGWGEGLEGAGRMIADRQQGECDIGVDILGPRLLLVFPCLSLAPGTEPAYRVIYISERQRLEAVGRPLPREGVLVGVVRIRGIDMAEVYDLRPGATAESPPP